MLLAWLGGVSLGVIVLFATVSGARLAVREVLLFPSFFAALPGSPLDRFSAAPVAAVVELPPVHGFVRAHVYRPRTGTHPALVLSLGLDPAPPDDPRVVRLLSGLARAGLVAILVESEALDHDQLYPDLPRALVEAVEFATGQPYAQAGRVGLFGFSVGGSLALVAAADPEIRDRLRWVEAFGSYARLNDALISVATHTLDDRGVIRQWEPDIAAQQHLANSLIGALADQTERDALTARYVQGDQSVTVDPMSLTSEGRAIEAMLNSRNRVEAEAVLPELPAVAAQNFLALSPLGSVSDLRTRLFIMYDRDDPLLPFTGSRDLCSVAKQARLRSYCSGFAIFQHVDPTRGGNPITVAHDLAQLYLHVYALLRLLE